MRRVRFSACGSTRFRHTISTLVEDGDAVACEVDVRGTHTGTLRTPTGDVPPTGRSVRIESATVVAIRDGKVATWRANFDLLGFMGQLGVLPAGGP
jgi:predicted ester cyclase